LSECSLKNRSLFHYFDTETLKSDDFARVVGQQPDAPETQIGKNLSTDADFMLMGKGHIVAVVRHEAIVHQPQAGAGLMQINQRAAASLGNAPEGFADQPVAIALDGGEHVTGDAVGMHPDQNAVMMGDIAEHQGQVRG
jgi:hypothetical protein